MPPGAWRRRSARAAAGARSCVRRSPARTTMRSPLRTARRWRPSARKSLPQSASPDLDGHHALAVELELLDRLEDVRHRLVLAFLAEALQELGLPAAHELLQRGDVEVAVMEVVFQPRHPAREEAAVLADGVAAHRRGVGGHVFREEL